MKRRRKEGDVAQFEPFRRHMDKLRLGKLTVSACNEERCATKRLCVFTSIIHPFGTVWTMPR